MKQRFKLLKESSFLRFKTPNLFPTFRAAGLSIVTAVLLCAGLEPAIGAESSSSALQIGDRVQTVSQTPVFLTPPYSGRFAGNQPAGMPGSILEGPLPRRGGLVVESSFRERHRRLGSRASNSQYERTTSRISPERCNGT